jgi:hypothetical protein
MITLWDFCVNQQPASGHLFRYEKHKMIEEQSTIPRIAAVNTWDDSEVLASKIAPKRGLCFAK